MTVESANGKRSATKADRRARTPEGSFLAARVLVGLFFVRRAIREF
jgi:hypothetical protein